MGERQWGDAPGMVWRNRTLAPESALLPEWTWECWVDPVELEHEVLPHATDTTMPSHGAALEALTAHLREHEDPDVHDAAHRYRLAVHAPPIDCPAWCRFPEHERTRT